MSLPIRRLDDLAESCVFTKQSQSPLYCESGKLHEQATSATGPPLLPKLRGQFAEFLSERSLARLSMFCLPTCVGLRYELPTIPRRAGCFLAVRPQSLRFGCPRNSPSPLVPPCGGTTGLARDVQHPGGPSPLRHQLCSSASPGGAGMFTGSPSPTPFGLSLGSPDPGRTNLPQEPLGFRRAGFSPAFSLLIPGSSLLPRPAVLSVRLHSVAARSPTSATCGGGPRRRRRA